MIIEKDEMVKGLIVSVSKEVVSGSIPVQRFILESELETPYGKQLELSCYGNDKIEMLSKCKAGDTVSVRVGKKLNGAYINHYANLIVKHEPQEVSEGIQDILTDNSQLYTLRLLILNKTTGKVEMRKFTGCMIDNVLNDEIHISTEAARNIIEQNNSVPQ